MHQKFIIQFFSLLILTNANYHEINKQDIVEEYINYHKQNEVTMKFINSDL